MRDALIEQGSWADFWPTAEPLLRAHRTEVATTLRPLKVNTGLCAALAKADVLLIWLAKDPSEGLVGYIMWFLAPNVEVSEMDANQGPWYVKPSWRNTPIGLRLLRKSLDNLRARGIFTANLHHRMACGGPDLTALFYRLGGKKTEEIFEVVLNRGVA